jgi:hypothetical protein
MQFYFEIEKLVKNMLIYTSLGSGVGKFCLHVEN